MVIEAPRAKDEKEVSHRRVVMMLDQLADADKKKEDLPSDSRNRMCWLYRRLNVLKRFHDNDEI
ncbi:hypothetical protein F444_18167 [Phytophthora nicotianae P1976]|uniref:Uncharacterized protein n=1 Tax=Phytophthora nicotianae P1976 TaxID=1317066 RepID=A0A080ZC99_PHYNI|nr:hypothetical protein F444_18167 [Phytophthora nicotianae P1976]